MPNWVYNTLTIQGPKDEIDSIKERLNRPFTKIHDSWNMKTGQMEISETKYPSPVFAFHNIHNHLEDGITDEEYVQQPDRSGIDMKDPNWFIKSVEHAKTQKDWYSWNNTNWGTKWDVAVADDDKYPNTVLEQYKSDGDDNWLVYRYETAWSPAVTILTKLSNLVPNSLLTLEFEEEQGWGGEYEIVRGEVTINLEYENRCYECQSYDTMDYNEELGEEFCQNCGDKELMSVVTDTITETKGN